MLGLRKPSLVATQRGPELTEQTPFQTISRPSEQVSSRRLKSLLGLRKVETEPPGISQVAPGSSPQVFDALRAIALRIENICQGESKLSKAFRRDGVEEALLPGALDQALQQSPSPKAAMIPHQHLAALSRLLHQLGEFSRSLGPFCLQRSRMVKELPFGSRNRFAVVRLYGLRPW